MNMLDGLKVEYDPWGHDAEWRPGVVLQSQIIKKASSSVVVLYMAILAEDGRIHIIESENIKFKPEDVEKIQNNPQKIIDRISRFELMEMD